MPSHVGFEAPARFVVRSWGDVTAEDILGAYAAILADPRLCRGATILGVAPDATSAPDAIDLRDLAAALVELRDKGVVAVANVASPGVVYGAAEMFSVFATRHAIRFRNFTDEAEARRYLNQAVVGATR